MFASASSTRSRTALDQPLSRTVEKTLGLREIASLDPAEEASSASSRGRAATPRYQGSGCAASRHRLVDGERAPEALRRVVTLAGLAQADTRVV
jgi:hypothetical protein